VQLTVINAQGCMGDTLLVGAVTVEGGVVGAILATPEPTDIQNPDVLLDGSALQGNIVTWQWDLGVADPAFADTPTVLARFPAVPGVYPVILVVTSAVGCIDTIRTVVRITMPGAIEMPNVFSPNGDGLNDRFVPLIYQGTGAYLEIFNRWGQPIFATRSIEQGWSGEGHPDGTYYYVVKLDDDPNKTVTGHITLLR
jgi:gliding motility-associated-like protein